MFLFRNKKKISLNYPQHPFLSGALHDRYFSWPSAVYTFFEVSVLAVFCDSPQTGETRISAEILFMRIKKDYSRIIVKPQTNLDL